MDIQSEIDQFIDTLRGRNVTHRQADQVSDFIHSRVATVAHPEEAVPKVGDRVRVREGLERDYAIHATCAGITGPLQQDGFGDYSVNDDGMRGMHAGPLYDFELLTVIDEPLKEDLFVKPEQEPTITVLDEDGKPEESEPVDAEGPAYAAGFQAGRDAVYAEQAVKAEAPETESVAEWRTFTREDAIGVASRMLTGNAAAATLLVQAARDILTYVNGDPTAEQRAQGDDAEPPVDEVPTLPYSRIETAEQLDLDWPEGTRVKDRDDAEWRYLDGEWKYMLQNGTPTLNRFALAHSYLPATVTRLGK